MPEPNGTVVSERTTLFVTEDPGIELFRRTPPNQKPKGHVVASCVMLFESMTPVPGAGDW